MDIRRAFDKVLNVNFPPVPYMNKDMQLHLEVFLSPAAESKSSPSVLRSEYELVSTSSYSREKKRL